MELTLNDNLTSDELSILVAWRRLKEFGFGELKVIMHQEKVGDVTIMPKIRINNSPTLKAERAGGKGGSL